MSNTNQLRSSPRVRSSRVALTAAGHRTSIAARMTITATTTTSGRGGLRSTTSAAAASSPRVRRATLMAAVGSRTETRSSVEVQVNPTVRPATSNGRTASAAGRAARPAAAAARTAVSRRAVEPVSTAVAREPVARTPVTRTAVGRTAVARRAVARTVVARTAASRTAAGAATARTASTAWSVATFVRENTQRSVSTRSDTVEDKAKSPTVEQGLVVPFGISLNTSPGNTSRNDVNCPICLMSIKAENRRALATRCGHVFCDVCLVESYRRKNFCPMCQQVMNETDFLELFF